MNNLTKQWLDNKLSGLYWCKITVSPYIEIVSVESIDKDYMTEVLAKVPSYDEWNELKHIITKTKARGNYPDKINQLKARITSLAEENIKLRKELSGHKEVCCCFENEVLRLENAKLKEQLEAETKIFNKIMDLAENVEPYEEMSNLIMCKELAENALNQIKQIGKSNEI